MAANDRKLLLLINFDLSKHSSLSDALYSSDYSFQFTDTCENAIRLIQAHNSYDTVIFIPEDVKETADFMKALREISTVPVMIYSGAISLEERLLAYDAGVDDCVDPSMPSAEILAKIAAMIRRYVSKQGKTVGGSMIHIDPDTRTVMKNGEVIEFTDLELNILEYLYDRCGEVVPIPELYEKIWRQKYLPGSQNAVMVHILNLRKKLEEDASHPKIIRTVRGKGYLMSM